MIFKKKKKEQCEVDVCVRGLTKWEKCKLDYASAIETCKKLKNQFSDETKIDGYNTIMKVASFAEEGNAKFHALDAQTNVFIFGFIFENRKAAEKFIGKCSKLYTDHNKLSAFMV